MERVKWIDIAKGISMLLIVIGHSLGSFSGGYLSNIIYAVNVPIFFVITGYLFQERKFKLVIKKGIRNLLIPYLFTSLLLLLFSYIRNHNTLYILKSMGSSKQVLLSILYGVGTTSKLNNTNITIHAIGAIWFLLALFIGNLLFNLTVKLSSKNHSLLFIIPIISCSLGFYIQGCLLLPLSINSALLCQVFYLFGYLLNKNKINLLDTNYLIIGIISWGISSLSGIFLVNISFATMQFPAIIGALGGSYCILYLSKKLESSNINYNIIQSYGRYSLVVLCFHLIDLNVIGITELLYNFFVNFVDIHIVSIIIIIYRILFTVFAIIIVKHSFFIKKIFRIN